MAHPSDNSLLNLKKYQIFQGEKKTFNVFHIKMHGISLLANMKNQQLVRWKGYIRIQAKRHTLTYTDTNPVEQSWAQIPYQPSEAQLGFHGVGGWSTFLCTRKKKSPFSNLTIISTIYSRKNLEHHSIGFGQTNKNIKKIQKRGEKRSKFKL